MPLPQRVLPIILMAVLSLGSHAAETYTHGPDSIRQPEVPKGTVTKHQFNDSKIYPGTTRDYHIYVPAQYDPAKPACVMIFQDGNGFASEKGRWRAPVVLDNLIHKKEIPVMIGVMVHHGLVPAAGDEAQPRFNRSFEYDGMGDRYARFLVEEILPEVAKKYNVKTDGNSRGILGSSSGAIAAFNAAWERPEEFSRVVSFVGTFVSLRGGHNFPWMIRKVEPKPLKIFMQDGVNDLDIYCGSWWEANRDVLRALEYSGYDVEHVWGTEGHNNKHGSAILPDALRSVWAGYPNPIPKPRHKGSRFLDVYIEGEEWEKLADEFQFTEGPAVDSDGNLFFTDLKASEIHRVDGKSGKVSLFAKNTGKANGLMFGPDGLLCACANGRKEIVAYSKDGSFKVVAKGLHSNDLVINPKGDMYVTSPGEKKVYYIPNGGKPRVVDTGIAKPNGVTFSPDHTVLMVSDTEGPFVYSFRIKPDGSLTAKQEYHLLHVPVGMTRSGADGVAMDDQGFLYVTSHFGIQICDQLGRVNAIMSKPQRQWISNITFGGDKMDTIYVTCGDAVFKRKINRRGVASIVSPIKPPKPGL